MNKRLLASLLTFFLLALPARAEDASSTYQPEFCEFSVTFPDEPYKTRRCDDEDKNRCYDQISFTHVFQLQSTVNFRVICNKIDQTIKDNYSGEVMKATLRAMTDRSVVNTFETSFREEKNYKQAGLVGEGKVGRTATIYIAQLWIGDKSAMSVEAELIGDPSDEADEMFSNILKTVRYNDGKAPEEEGKPESQEDKKESSEDSE